MKKGIAMNMKWIFWLLFGMGAFFIGIGVLVYLAAGDMTAVSSGQSDVSPIVFLFVFGGIGAIIIAAAAIFIGTERARAKLGEQLMQAGTFCLADIADVSQRSNVRANNFSPFVLRCTYKHDDGQTYMFKSRYLRYNPQSLIPDGKVKVWFDPYDITRYFVDVDGSLKERIIEV